LLGQLEKDFHAKPVSGASSEKISDIDLSTYGTDAGADMIKAEEHMKSLFGPGWSEALRMNFYTEAGRLTLYEKVMPGLSKAEQASLLGQVTADAEKLNVAKMLAHAEGNPSRIAEVEAYAKKMGVDVKDPKIQELVPKLAGGGDVVARNKALLEIDALTKQAAAATPGSPEHLDLVKRITSKQMEVNALTAEAYIGPGAGRMTVSGVKVIGQEAYQAAMSNLEMIQHIMHECAGDVVTASREYEMYKYINRFAEAAENAGAKTQGLDYWKNFSGFASKDRASSDERSGASRSAPQRDDAEGRRAILARQQSNDRKGHRPIPSATIRSLEVILAGGARRSEENLVGESGRVGADKSAEAGRGSSAAVADRRDKVRRVAVAKNALSRRA
jgi:hypothetical protein